MRKDSIGLFWEDLPPPKRVKKEKIRRTPPERVWERPDYLPFLEEALAFNVPLFTQEELIIAATKRERLIFDIECYPNYFCIAFQSIESGKVIFFERDEDDLKDVNIPLLNWIMHTFCIVGFNSKNYDEPIAALALAGKSCPDMWEATSLIIVGQMRPSDVLKKFKVKKLKSRNWTSNSVEACIDHIDLIEIAPLDASLKKCAGRLHAHRMQDLPFKPGSYLSSAQKRIVLYYCCNDLRNTALLYFALGEELELREMLSRENGMDLRSRSDAQIAESILSVELQRLNGRYPLRPSIEVGTAYRYKVPQFIQYYSDLMNWVLHQVRNSLFIVGPNGSIDLPESIKAIKIPIGKQAYQMGIGGLHSTEEHTSHRAEDGYLIEDIDVVSYYPWIILNQGLYPEHLGTNFLRAFRPIVERRIKAKQAGQKKIAQALKITINGTFGKLGSKWSMLYAPDLLIQTTITGQLSILMLIEQFELAGFQVLSANTDGVVVRYHESKKDLKDRIVKEWERGTRFETESTFYSALYSKDVNNYVAVKTKGGVKTKGVYSEGGLAKNPTGEICRLAVMKLLTDKVPIVNTIRSSRDVRQFVHVRYVNGGAVKDGNYLGKVVRWYYAADETGEIVYAKTGNKVPRSEKARPLMDLPQVLPADIDYDFYIHETEKMLEAIKYY